MNKKRILILFFIIFISPSTLFAVPAGKIVTWEGGGQGTVKFEGDEHDEKGYKCDACHPSLFQMRRGVVRITMESLNKGQFCGACHNGKTAFGTNNKKKCHKCHKTDKKHSQHKDKHHE